LVAQVRAPQQRSFVAVEHDWPGAWHRAAGDDWRFFLRFLRFFLAAVC
jgi:hypothetical protein